MYSKSSFQIRQTPNGLGFFFVCLVSWIVGCWFFVVCLFLLFSVWVFCFGGVFFVLFYCFGLVWDFFCVPVSIFSFISSSSKINMLGI